jgi:hypothetical protein
MELLERYLQSVRFFLPKHQQDDIVRELSENLVSEMEDRENAAGRPLTEDEQADLLRRHGHPMIVAGRYGTRQQLIGPALFAIYAFALKMGLGVALLVTVLLATLAAVLTGDPVRHFVQAMLQYPGRALMVFALTTLVFAVLDYAQSHGRLRHAWDPRTLPRLVKREHWTSRAGALFELLATVAAIVWLLLIPGAPHVLLGPAASFLELAPIWRVVYVPLVLLMASAAALSATGVIRPYWTPARSFARIGLHAGTVAIVGVVHSAGEWVLAKPAAATAAGASADRLVDVINASCEIGLAVTALIGLIEIGREVYRLRRRSSDSLTFDPASPPASRKRAR